MRLLYYFILLPISRLPESFQYGLAKLLNWILKDVVRYRRPLIEKNLALCFPSANEEVRIGYLNDFYANAFSLPKKSAESRMTVMNPEVLNRLFDLGKDVIITGGHYTNWETATLTARQLKHEVYALYKPLKNVFIDGQVQGSRSKFGVHMISIKDFRSYMSEPHDRPRAFIFGIDQSPRKNSAEWITFLGRDTLVFTGPERISKEFNMAVVSGQIRRSGRGKYELFYEVLFENPLETRQMQITEVTMKEVEKQILEYPGDWLWSHNRWKHHKSEGTHAQ
jgi:Kdo2-lipid IVA lauroyltransferase/acyltransferase